VRADDSTGGYARAAATQANTNAAPANSIAAITCLRCTAFEGRSMFAFRPLPLLHLRLAQAEYGNYEKEKKVTTPVDVGESRNLRHAEAA